MVTWADRSMESGGVAGLASRKSPRDLSDPGVRAAPGGAWGVGANPAGLAPPAGWGNCPDPKIVRAVQLPGQGRGHPSRSRTTGQESVLKRAVKRMLLDRLTPTGGSFAGEPGVLELALPAEPSSAAAARHSLAAYCRDHGVPTQLTDDALLVISELVTNAVLHAGTPTMAWAEYEPGSITVAVVDGSSSLPALLAPSERRESGRGVAIIDELGATWGLIRTSLGKIIWVNIR
jgi:anti-sigma regulatory factor (Ser/Thr protein kinase)